MAMRPLAGASRATERAAIDHHGGESKPSAAAGVLACVSRIPRIDRGLVMALRNTVRRRARFILAVSLLASAGTVFVAGVSLSASVSAVEQAQAEQRNWHIDIQLATPAALNDLTR